MRQKAADFRRRGKKGGGSIGEWDLEHGTETRVWPIVRAQWRGGAELSRAGVVRCDDGTSALIDLVRGEEKSIPVGGLAIEPGDFSPDGRPFAAPIGRGVVGMWETKAFQRVATLTGFTLGAHSTVFSPDGRRLAVASNSAEAVRLFDVDGWKQLLTFAAAAPVFTWTAFSPDGNALGSMACPISGARPRGGDLGGGAQLNAQRSTSDF